MTRSTRSRSSSEGSTWVRFVPAVALIVSILALIRACSSDQRSRQNELFTQTQSAAAFLPALQLTYYPAHAASIDSTDDAAFVAALGLHPTVLKSTYWRELSARSPSRGARFLFMLISNYGPGTATDMTISGIWTPREGLSAPSGVFELEGASRTLANGWFFALLVDYLDTYNPALELTEQDARNFDNLGIAIEYATTTGEQHRLDVAETDLGPALVIP